MYRIAPEATRTSLPPDTTVEQDVVTAAKGGSIYLVGSMFSYALRFVMGIFLARLLGAEQFGLYELTTTTVIGVAASICTLGMGSALVRYVAVFHSRKDTKGLWGTLQIGLGFPAILSLAVGIALFALATPIAEGLFHEPRLIPLVRLASLGIPFTTLVSVMAAATRGFKKMQYSVIAEEISLVLIQLILLVLLAIVGLNAARAVGANVLTTVMVSGLLLYYLNKLFSLKRPLRTARRDTKELLNFALPVYVANVIFTFRGSLQSALLGVLHAIEQVGVFYVADRITSVGTMIVNSVVMTSMPIVSELYDRRKIEQLGHFYQTMTKWIFTLNLPFFLIVMLFPEAILSIFGQSFVDGNTALTILAGASLVFAATAMGGVLIDYTGHTRLKLVNTVITTVLAFGLSFLLIPSWGMVGAACGVLANNVIMGFIRLLEIFVLLRLQPYNFGFVKPISAGVVAYGMGMALGNLLPPEEKFIYLVSNVAIVLATYAAVILLLGLSQEDRTVLVSAGRRVKAILSK